jgi:hypothetical protein
MVAEMQAENNTQSISTRSISRRSSIANRHNTEIQATIHYSIVQLCMRRYLCRELQL